MRDMRRMRLQSVFLVLIMILSSLAIVSVSGQNDNNSSTTENMIIKGTVSHAGTDKVIPRAWVTLRNDLNEFKTFTNEEGFYSFEVPMGWYVIAAGAEGYHEQKAEIGGEHELIIKDFYLEPLEVPHKSMLVGEVFNGVTNEAIGGAMIVLMHGDTWREKTVSHENGYYEFEGIPTGVFVIHAKAEGYMEFENKIEIPAGETVKFPIKLMPIKEHEGLVLCGMVTNVLRLPIPGAIVSLEAILENDERPDSEDWGYHARTVTDEHGYYKFGDLKPGWYFIHAEAEGYHEYNEELKLPFWEENNNVDRENVFKHNIMLEFLHHDRPRPRLSGQVFDACTDKPIFNACVVITKGEPSPCCWEALKGPCPWEHEKPPERPPERPPEDPDRPPERPPEDPDRPPERPPEDPDRPPERPPEDPDEEDRPTRCGGCDDCQDDRERERERDERPDDRPERPEQNGFFMWCVYTDRMGHYEYPWLEPGHYNMWVSAPGYISYYNEFDLYEDPMNIDVYLRPMPLLKQPKREPNALLKGHVFDEVTQQPIAGAQVMVVDPQDVFQPELLKEKPLETKEDYKKLEKTRGDGDKSEYIDKPLESNERDGIFTDRSGYFEVKIPSGAHILVVVARGYEKAVQRILIDEKEELTVRVPMEPMDGESPSRPGANEDGERLRDGGTESSDPSNPKSSSSSSAASAAGAAGAALNWVLVALLTIVVVLSMIVFRKYQRKPMKDKKTGK